jgi:hypothetical protein
VRQQSRRRWRCVPCDRRRSRSSSGIRRGTVLRAACAAAHGGCGPSELPPAQTVPVAAVAKRSEAEESERNALLQARRDLLSAAPAVAAAAAPASASSSSPILTAQAAPPHSLLDAQDRTFLQRVQRSSAGAPACGPTDAASDTATAQDSQCGRAGHHRRQCARTAAGRRGSCRSRQRSCRSRSSPCTCGALASPAVVSAASSPGSNGRDTRRILRPRFYEWSQRLARMDGQKEREVAVAASDLYPFLSFSERTAHKVVRWFQCEALFRRARAVMRNKQRGGVWMQHSSDSLRGQCTDTHARRRGRSVRSVNHGK